MNGVNLIPAARRAAKRRARHIRVWLGVAAGCVLAAAGAQGLFWHLWSPQGDDPAPEIQRLTSAIASAEQQDKAAKNRLREAQAQAAASREIADQPDWGVLVTFLAKQLGRDAAFESLRLSAAAKPVKGNSRGGRSLVLTGIAPTQEAASSVAIDLKNCGLFESVTLAETRRTDFMGAKAVSFQIECAIVGAGGGD